jgi:hypothetical protein
MGNMMISFQDKGENNRRTTPARENRRLGEAFAAMTY